MIKPIETQYDGYFFRSRLEARWAVFFKSLGVPYEYEPEGFRRNGVWYLPDFRVKCWGLRGEKSGPPFDLYIEVKGNMDAESAEKLKTFTQFGEAWVEEMKRETGAVYPDWEEYCYKTTDEYIRACAKYDAILEEWVKKNLLPVLVVGDIPEYAEDFNVMDKRYPFGSACGIAYNSYEGIDGDSFGAMPAADKAGRFYLFGQDSNYVNKEDVERVTRAYLAARSARFEHGQNGAII